MKKIKTYSEEVPRIALSIEPFPKIWLLQFYELLNRLIVELGLGPEDERIALTATQNRKLNFNIGKRWVVQPQKGQFLHILVTPKFDEKVVQGEVLGNFQTTGVVDGHWIRVPFPVGSKLPEPLYQNWKLACWEELQRIKRSRVRSYHSPLLYLLITDPSTREEWDQWADLS